MSPTGMACLLRLALVALISLTACDSGPRAESAPGHPLRPPESCALDSPPRPGKGERFRPPVRVEDGEARMGLTFLDGTTATLLYPASLRIGQLGARPDTTGGEPGRAVRPRIDYGGTSLTLKGPPTRCLRTPRGSLAGVWEHPDGEVLVLRFGRWYLSIFETHTDLRTWARHLQGRVTRHGWLTLSGDRHLRVGPEQQFGDTSIMLGLNLAPGVILWPLRCRGQDASRKEVAAGRGVESLGKDDFFASWCDARARVVIHAYATTESWIRRVARDLQIIDVSRTYPLSRYHIVP